MTSIARICLLVSLALAALLQGCATTAPAGAPAADPRALTFAPLRFEVPKTERLVLANGMVVHLLQDRELPIVSMTAYVNAGSVYEPAAQAGLAGLTGAVMRSGGTASLTPEALDAELEFMASSVESSIGSGWPR